MNVSLTDELERFISDQVERGRYRSASEVVRHAVRLLQDQAQEHEAKLALLRKAIEAGVEELDRDGGIEADRVFSDVLSRLDRSEEAA